MTTAEGRGDKITALAPFPLLCYFNLCENVDILDWSTFVLIVYAGELTFVFINKTSILDIGMLTFSLSKKVKKFLTQPLNLIRAPHELAMYREDANLINQLKEN